MASTSAYKPSRRAHRHLSSTSTHAPTAGRAPVGNPTLAPKAFPVAQQQGKAILPDVSKLFCFVASVFFFPVYLAISYSVCGGIF